MIRISRNEAMKLNKMGFQFADGTNNGVLHKTHSNKISYYLTENEKVLKAYRNLHKCD